MEILWIVLAGIALLAALYILSTMGRTRHPGWEGLKGWCFAHRGLHNETVPENSMAAFRDALAHGYGIELDLHLTADGELAVIHDSSLKRTAGADVEIEDLTLEELPNYRLEGTDEQIPTFRQVLELFDGKAPMVVELKAARGNHAALTDAACRMLESYRGKYCMESFDPRCVLHLKKHYPHIIRGQLSANFLKEKGKMPWILKLAMTNHLCNIITRPDFVAYKFADRKNVSNFLARKLWGVQGVTWTLRSPEEHKQALSEGWIPIFEYYEP